MFGESHFILAYAGAMLIGSLVDTPMPYYLSGTDEVNLDENIVLQQNNRSISAKSSAIYKIRRSRT